MQILNKASYVLNFSDGLAQFYLDDSELSMEEVAKISAFTGVSSGKSWWQDLDSAYNKPHKVFFEQQDYIIPFALDADTGFRWVLTNERRKIGDYTCVKATKGEWVYAPREEKEFKVVIVAWYCPDLPFPFGPEKYGGLPGLIVELETMTTKYTLERIEFKDNIPIPGVPQHQRISKKEHAAFMHRAMKEFMDNHEPKKSY